MDLFMCACGIVIKKDNSYYEAVYSYLFCVHVFQMDTYVCRLYLLFKHTCMYYSVFICVYYVMLCNVSVCPFMNS